MNRVLVVDTFNCPFELLLVPFAQLTSLVSLARSRRATIATASMFDALGEVTRLVGENTKRDPLDLLTLEEQLGKGY